MKFAECCCRLAPSPTGALHVGNIRTLMLSWLLARSRGGRVLLRIEDLDHPKHKPGATEALIDDLRWLGFDWDGEVLVQSQRTARYHEALTTLQTLSRVYPCVCSRQDVESVQSAPHAGEVLRYPGTCRGRFASYAEAAATLPDGRLPAWRFALNPDDDGRFTDGFAGYFERTAAELTGDFVFGRGEAGVGYPLAVVVDDAASGVTDVVRGDDLLDATPSQIILYRTLGLSVPRFWHVPLVVGPDGRRLAKRHGDTRIATYRQAGMPATRLLQALARSCNWSDRIETLRDLIPHFTFETIPHEPLIWKDVDL